MHADIGAAERAIELVVPPRTDKVTKIVASNNECQPEIGITRSSA